jgi:hypothetical protein
MQRIRDLRHRDLTNDALQLFNRLITMIDVFLNSLLFLDRFGWLGKQLHSILVILAFLSLFGTLCLILFVLGTIFGGLTFIIVGIIGIFIFFLYCLFVSAQGWLIGIGGQNRQRGH